MDPPAFCDTTSGDDVLELDLESQIVQAMAWKDSHLLVSATSNKKHFLKLYLEKDASLELICALETTFAVTGICWHTLDKVVAVRFSLDDILHFALGL